MSTAELEQRLAAVEQAVADIRHQLDRTPAEPSAKWWERIGRRRSSEELTAFDEAAAFGRYFRATGQLPPSDWMPGDPIPEPESEP